MQVMYIKSDDNKEHRYKKTINKKNNMTMKFRLEQEKQRFEINVPENGAGVSIVQ